MSDIFGSKAFDVEHALDMYAADFATMPASEIYNNDAMNSIRSKISNCHIYMVGFVPLIDFIGASQKYRKLITHFEVHGKQYDVSWDIQEGINLKHEDGLWWAEDGVGRRFFPSSNMMQNRLSVQHGVVGFEVLYIGQAFGKDGSRTALDRLLKHETLQKISLKGTPDGYRLTVLMLGIQRSNSLITIFNPWAEDRTMGEERISSGLDKLYETNEAERTTLYEASLIRYFQPPYNKEFKDSFPSTNLKVLADCYEKDISAIIAEICIAELPFQIFSKTIAPQFDHIITHDLHTDERRKVFFA